MKRRVAPLLTFTIALILVGGIAYAAKKKEHAKLSDHIPDALAEEEALKAELLDATENREHKLPLGTGAKKIPPGATYKKIKGKTISKQPRQ